jgi:hypothetical protein
MELAISTRELPGETDSIDHDHCVRLRVEHGQAWWSEAVKKLDSAL